eukprot:GGOE01046902.1.p1 GENE.GGOE01046902.1~~GGOE01046902.1.p1  ORF type:complete len:291 (-),score=57.80 GGOE01046902.1:110-982(-)
MSRLLGHQRVSHGEDGQPRLLQASPANGFRPLSSNLRAPNGRPLPPLLGGSSSMDGMDSLLPRPSSSSTLIPDFFSQHAPDIFPRQVPTTTIADLFVPQIPEIKLSVTDALQTAPVGSPPAALGAVDVDPCLQPSGMVTIGGQTFVLMPVPNLVGSAASQPEISPRPPPPPAATNAQSPSQRTRRPSPSQKMPRRPKSTASNFPNIQVLSDKVDSTIEHGYYLCGPAAAATPASTSATTTPFPSEVDTEAATQQPQPPPFPTYTYNYGNEVDQGVWDILRKSMQKGPSTA